MVGNARDCRLDEILREHAGSHGSIRFLTRAAADNFGGLLESNTIHVLEKFVFLDKLILQHMQFCGDLFVLILEIIDLDFGHHILFI